MAFKTAFERLEDKDALYVKHVDHVHDCDWNKLIVLHVFLKKNLRNINKILRDTYINFEFLIGTMILGGFFM